MSASLPETPEDELYGESLIEAEDDQHDAFKEKYDEYTKNPDFVQFLAQNKYVAPASTQEDYKKYVAETVKGFADYMEVIAKTHLEGQSIAQTSLDELKIDGTSTKNAILESQKVIQGLSEKRAAQVLARGRLTEIQTEKNLPSDEFKVVTDSLIEIDHRIKEIDAEISKEIKVRDGLALKYQKHVEARDLVTNHADAAFQASVLADGNLNKVRSINILNRIDGLIKAAKNTENAVREQWIKVGQEYEKDKLKYGEDYQLVINKALEVDAAKKALDEAIALTSQLEAAKTNFMNTSRVLNNVDQTEILRIISAYESTPSIDNAAAIGHFIPAGEPPEPAPAPAAPAPTPAVSDDERSTGQPVGEVGTPLANTGGGSGTGGSGGTAEGAGAPDPVADDEKKKKKEEKTEKTPDEPDPHKNLSFLSGQGKDLRLNVEKNDDESFHAVVAKENNKISIGEFKGEMIKNEAGYQAFSEGSWNSLGVDSRVNGEPAQSFTGKWDTLNGVPLEGSLAKILVGDKFRNYSSFVKKGLSNVYEFIKNGVKDAYYWNAALFRFEPLFTVESPEKRDFLKGEKQEIRDAVKSTERGDGDRKDIRQEGREARKLVRKDWREENRGKNDKNNA